MRTTTLRGVIGEHTAKLRDILARLDAASTVADMDCPASLASAQGDFKGFWAITVRANWRVIFRLSNGDTLDIDYVDYHLKGSCMPMKNPPHPGGFVLRQCIEPLGLTITQAAGALGVTRTTLSELVNEKRGISPENGGPAIQGPLAAARQTWLNASRRTTTLPSSLDRIKLKTWNSP